MRTNNVLGILYSNSYDEALPELTSLRTMGSVPFGGRYRMIDFPLSSMVRAGITKVGVVTKANYRSLMDHLGMGKSWDLARKHEGLVILPPFVGAGTSGNQTRMEGLWSALEFLRNSKEEFVIMSDCNVVCNLDYRAILEAHAASGADITVACRGGEAPALRSMRLALDDAGRAREISVSGEPANGALYALNIFVLRKELLERLTREANSQSLGDYEILQRNVKALDIRGLEIEGYARVIDGLRSYYGAHMELLLPQARRALFRPEQPVFTKVQDDMPAIYGLHSRASNCLVADGCQIKGEAENSVLFRGVTIEEGARVNNCVLMQGTRVGAGAHLECVISDKSVVIRPGKTIIGAEDYPIYLGKRIVV
ncbi:MAG: glucose-1-phosphate adenylyltransferase subunit GlgD [Oscillospiraceae bacterium]|jgi:glucose-1-phosphate adenylyltransferase|nr:glucose-1-phosphate adenylyltransferase subunit GlgD [Oscillospiraceae bacterium]